MKALWNAFLAGSGKPVTTTGELLPGAVVVPPRADGTATDTSTAPVPREIAVAAGAEPEPPPLPPTAPPISLTVDHRGDLTFIDPVVAAMFGYTPPEVLGRNLHLLFPLGLPPASAAGESASQPAVGLSKAGKRFPLQVVVPAASGEAERSLTVQLHRSHELEVRGDVAGLVSGWQDAEQELIAAQQSREAALAELAAARAEVSRLQQALASSPREASPPVEPVATPVLPEATRRELEAGRRQLEEQAGLLRQARQTACDLDERVAALTAQVTELKAQLDRAHAETRAGAETAARLQGELDAARVRTAQVTEWEAQLAGVQAQAQASAAQMARLQAELAAAQARLQASEQETRAVGQAIEDGARELAAARVVLATLQHERDHWQALAEEARTRADTHADAAAHWEREGATLAARSRDLEQALVEARQREAEQRQAAESAGAQLAASAAALAASQQAQRGREEEVQRLAADWQQELQRRTRAEHAAEAAIATTQEISHELASARVVLETLRQERDLWQAQAKQAQAEAHGALAQLAATEERHRHLEEVAERTRVLLRRTLELTATEGAPLLSELQAALVRTEAAASV